MSTKAAFQAIEKEVVRAKEKFPWWPTDPIHAAGIVSEEAGELVRAANQLSYEKGLYSDMLDEAVQVGAMAVRFIENIKAYEPTTSDKVYEG